MNLKKPLYLQVFYNTEETHSLENLGLDCEDNKYAKIEIMFLSIDSIGKTSTKRNTTTIVSGGNTFEVDIPYSELKQTVINYI